MSSKNNTVRPFNMAQDEYEKMFESSLPSSFAMIVFFDATAGHTAKQQSDFRQKVTEYISANSESNFIKQLMSHPKSGTRLTLEMFVERVIGWDAEKPTTDSDYAIVPFTVSFCEESQLNTQIALGTTVAMKRYDVLVLKNNSIEPHKQVLFPVTEEVATFDKRAIGDIYKSGAGIWCRELVEKRNMFSITLWAIMLGLDPEVEWKKFIQAGGWHYTQYPILCP